MTAGFQGFQLYLKKIDFKNFESFKYLNSLIITMMIEVGVKDLASNFDEILEKGEEEPEEMVAELLESIGLVERKDGKVKLTRTGEKFLELPVE